MNKLRYLLLLIAAGSLLGACKPEAPREEKLRIGGLEAVGPYLTKDPTGNAVLCWTEQDATDSLNRLKYAVYDAKREKFGEAITVLPSAGTGTSPESMNKVAFKQDGSVIAVFSKKFKGEKNPYAGAIYYSMSVNGGKQWSEPRFLHSDTTHTYGRSFFDIARLKDGEIGAVWLDGRYGKANKGSALFFSKTAKGKGFGMDKCVDKSTCECCRTDLLTDAAGDIHIAYRSIQFPSGPLGKQVRDMVYVSSVDNGETFSTARAISKDNWAIESCPHTGPSLAITGKQVNALWFTASGNPGLYFTYAADRKQHFNPKQLQSEPGRHPQMISLDDGSLAMVWEEDQSQGHQAAEKQPMHSGMSHDHAAAAPSKIVLNLFRQHGKSGKTDLTHDQQPNHHAVITGLDKWMLIAWVKEEKGHAGIYYTFLEHK